MAVRLPNIAKAIDAVDKNVVISNTRMSDSEVIVNPTSSNSHNRTA
jgi:hypothetical protein